jgi:NAD-dependent SIR2 family protein deacetylase
MGKNVSAVRHADCEICKHNHPFDLPVEVLEAAREHRLVIFAGAGISTEVPAVMPYTFYDQVASELGLDPRSITTSFPDLMTKYCSQPNGRRKLLQKLKERFDYIESFPDLLRSATRFHQELSTIPHLDDIVTTNWDSYFERFCGAVPFVSPADFVFWNVPGRKIFKLHGSVSSYGSIVATNEDYDKSHTQLTAGIVGSNLKLLLATKVVVFVGYSLRDYDFERIYEFLRNEMGELLPQAYVITLANESADRFRSLGLIPIVTDGTYFLHVLKDHLASDGLMIPDDRFDAVWSALLEVQSRHDALHKAFSYTKSPELLYCACYQDGMMDAFGRIASRKHTGEYSCRNHVRNLIDRYLQIQKSKAKSRKYVDVAYVEGYINGLVFILADDKERKAIPWYFVFGFEGGLRSLAQYRRVCKRAKSLHSTAYAKACEVTSKLEGGVEFHHSPFLL